MQIFEDVLEAYKNGFAAIFVFIIFSLLVITIPVWIFPFLIYKKVKQRSDNNAE